MDEFNLHVIGCGSALSMHGRHPSAQVIQYNNVYCLIDCGEGTQDRLREAGIKPFKIDIILISHLHGDHVFGLPGLLGSFGHLKRTEPLSIYGPAGIKGMLESIMTYSNMKVPFPLHIYENSPTGLQPLWSDTDIEILTFPLNHRVACNGYLFKETKSKVKFRKEKVEAFSLTPEQIKAVGRGEVVTIGGEMISASSFIYPPQAPMSYAYCSDTRYDQRIKSYINGVSVLFHEATFMHDKADLAELTGHSTARQAGQMALEVNAACLITGHFSSRYKDLEPLKLEAEEVFNHVIVAEEGKKYNLKSLLYSD